MTPVFSILRKFSRFLVTRFREDALMQVAGSLTFTTLLALVPIITIALTVFSAFPAFGAVTTGLKNFIVANFVPGAASKLITIYMQQFAEKASRLTAVGIAALGVTSVMLMLTIDRVFNRIWRVRRPRPLLQRLLVYWTVLTVGPLLIGVSLYATSWLITASLGLINEQDSGGPLFKLFATALTCLALAFLYRTVPNRKIEPLDAAIGGTLAGLGFEAMKSAFANFITHFGNYKLVYGAFAGLPVFLLWIYLSWIVVLAGAVITAAIPFIRAGGWTIHRVPGSRFIEAMQLLRMLANAHREGQVLSLPTLAQGGHLSLEDAETMLDRMRSQGWVARSGAEGWLLARDPRTIRVVEIYREFVFQTDAVRHEARAMGLESLTATLAQGVEREVAMSLEEALLPLAAERGVAFSAAESAITSRRATVTPGGSARSAS
jgi:membrane protein